MLRGATSEVKVKKFLELNDDELAILARSDDMAMESLIRRFEPLVRGKARSFYLVGGDGEDLVQIGRVALSDAVKSYDPARSGGFKTFALICVKRKLIDAIKSANRLKHLPLNGAMSIDGAPDGEDAPAIENVIPSRDNPEVTYIETEDYNETVSTIKTELSRLELEILRLYLSGKNYSEIASVISNKPKYVDNSIQRIKRKIRKALAVSDSTKISKIN